METKKQSVVNEVLRKKYYLSEYEFFDGDEYIKFNIIDIDLLNKKIAVAITNRGNISVCNY